MWRDFGFNRNLYDTHPIKGDLAGERLLVGRETELRSLKNRIKNVDSVVSVEGPNGVGKTSLVLVAGFQLSQATLESGKSSLILLPDPLQFTPEDDATTFKRKAYAQIASYFIANQNALNERLDLQFNLSPLRRWLESPMQMNANLQIAGFGGGGGSTTNTSGGFDSHGFFNLVDQLLQDAFNGFGGIICVLDNLEILNTSQVARQRLEALRDDLFSKHGIKWVVCGARGIVKSVASSPRLQGRLQ